MHYIKKIKIAGLLSVIGIFVFVVSIAVLSKLDVNNSNELTKRALKRNLKTLNESDEFDIPDIAATNVLGDICNCMTPQGICVANDYILITAYCNVENYKEFLSLQCDSALINIVRIYPYDVAPNVDTTGDGVADEGSLRGSSEVVAQRIKDEIQSKVEEAGLEVVEARITYLAYAPEIAAVMLQRQQASAIIDARKMIVDGAVGMVEMALERLNENDLVTLDDERKAAMVSNLLVVLCGNHDAQPIVNTGSLY